MRHHRVDIENDKTYFRLKSTGDLRQKKITRYWFSEQSTYFILERRLVNGSSLPNPSLAWEQAGWIAEYQWDMLIFMWSNAEIGVTTETYSGLNAAYKWCALNRGMRGQEEKERRKQNLFPGMVRAGLIEITRISPGGLRQYKELKLSPVRRVNGEFVPSGLARTPENLRKSRRKWFKMAYPPMSLPGKRTLRGERLPVWGDYTHRDRRTLVALYFFFQETTCRAVDPNHLCVRGDWLYVSQAFLRVCGSEQNPVPVYESLGALWRAGLLGFSAAVFDDDPDFPATQPHIRFATRSSIADAHGDALVGLKYVPKVGGLDEAGG